jgi:hypothetical protein
MLIMKAKVEFLSKPEIGEFIGAAYTTWLLA